MPPLPTPLRDELLGENYGLLTPWPRPLPDVARGLIFMAAPDNLLLPLLILEGEPSLGRLDLRRLGLGLLASIELISTSSLSYSA